MKFAEIQERCWTGYRQAGMKKKGDRQVPNCVPVEEVRIGPEITGKDLLFKAAAMAMRDAGREGINLDYEQAIRQASKIYGIPYMPSELPKLLAQRAEIDRQLAMLKQGKQVAKQRRQAKLAPTPAGAEEYWRTHALPTDRIKPPAKTLEETEAELSEDLKKWFKQKWVRFGPDGKIRGDCARGSKKEGKPKCLPAAKAHALGKKGRASAAAKKRREDPNPERRGPAKNVATKVKEQHDWDDADEFGMPGSEFFPDEKTGYRVIFKGRIIGVFDAMPKATEIAKRLEQKYGGQARVEHTVDEAQTDYQKRRQRERDIDAGRPVKSLPKNPKTDYQKRREQQRRDQDLGEANINETDWPTVSIPSKSVLQGYTVEYDAGARKVQISRGGDIVDQFVFKGTPNLRSFRNTIDRRIGQLVDAQHGIDESQLDEKQDACYRKVKSRYKVWPSAYASGALVQCRKKGAANWGNKKK